MTEATLKRGVLSVRHRGEAVLASFDVVPVM